MTLDGFIFSLIKSFSKCLGKREREKKEINKVKGHYDEEPSVVWFTRHTTHVLHVDNIANN